MITKGQEMNVSTGICLARIKQIDQKFSQRVELFPALAAAAAAAVAAAAGARRSYRSNSQVQKITTAINKTLNTDNDEQLCNIPI